MNELKKREDMEIGEYIDSIKVYGETKNGDLSDNALSTGSVADCPKCGNNRQVWVNQQTGRLTCHRAFCHTEIKGTVHDKEQP